MKMDVKDILKKEGFIDLVINELKSYGVKYQKGKKKKNVQNKTCRKKIFCTHLHLLELTDVILVTGEVAQIPKFVADACNRILEQVETEGLFRKAGSFARQKEIRLNLEAGKALGKKHHVIDVANVIKFFFRELPEPLIPPYIQDTFLQSLLIVENNVNAILLSCLLLPPLALSTLSFIMQFLYTVSLNQCYNKMSVENLAIILTPGIMPCLNINSSQFFNHVKIISILIENSNNIGVIPYSIKNKIVQQLPLSKKPIALYGTFPESELNASEQIETKQKKKRRSDMFNGLKRIVGTAMGSSEFLDNTPEENKNSQRKTTNEQKCIKTPCTKEVQKLKTGEAIITKKKNPKMSRLSFGGTRNINQPLSHSGVISMERRWNNIESGWAKNKESSIDNKKKCTNICHEKVRETYNIQSGNRVSVGLRMNSTGNTEKSKKIENKDIFSEISNKEYAEIKDRLAAIEARITSEFTELENPIVPTKFSGPEQVQVQYERIILKTEALTSSDAEHLTQRLNRDLKIQQSIIRSPSARKIGSIRRRSLDKSRLPRNSTCNFQSTNITCKECKPAIGIEKHSQHICSKLFNCKNKVFPFKSSTERSLSPQGRYKEKCKTSFANMCDDSNEQWMSGEDFFDSTKTKCSLYKVDQDTFSQTHVEYELDLNGTPDIAQSLYTKNSSTPSNFISTSNKSSFINCVTLLTPSIDEICGRSSIARLRTKNAGMVMAKAKLFDGLELYSKNRQTSLKDQNSKNNEVFNKSFIAQDQKSFFTADNIFLIEPNSINILPSKLESTPIAKRIHNINLSSPMSSSKRRRGTNTNKCNKQEILQTIIDDEKLVKNFNKHRFPHSNNQMDLNQSKKIATSYARSTKLPKVVTTHRQNSKLCGSLSANKKQN